MGLDEVHMSFKSVIHMLFHILGRYHEHQRADKDCYISVIKENVIEGIQVFVIV